MACFTTRSQPVQHILTFRSTVCKANTVFTYRFFFSEKVCFVFSLNIKSIRYPFCFLLIPFLFLPSFNNLYLLLWAIIYSKLTRLRNSILVLDIMSDRFLYSPRTEPSVVHIFGFILAPT